MAEATATKVCTKCRQAKLLTEFHVRRASSDGLKARCKSCAIAARRAYGREYPDRVALAGKAWRDKNPGYSASSARRWREQNPDRVRENHDRWATENAEHLAAAKRAWFKANQERLTAERDPESDRARHARYRLRHADKRRADQARRRALLVAADVQDDVDLDALWTGACGICAGLMRRDLKHPDPMSKSIDHIVPLAKGGSHTQGNLQWAHLRCNTSKGARLIT